MQNFFSKYSKYIGIGITIVFLWLFLSWLSDIVIWVVLAWVVSLLGSPLMKLLHKIKIKQFRLSSSIRALIVLFFFYIVIGLFFALFVPVIVQQGRNLAEVDYASLMLSLEEPISHFNDWLVDKGLSDGEKWHKTYADSSANNLLVKDTIDQYSFNSMTINVDSILLNNGDTVTKTNINLDLNINYIDKDEKANHFYDSTALVNPDDTPFEQLRKKVFQYVSPSQIITRVVFYAVNLFGNFLILISSVTFIAFFFLKDEELFGRILKAAVPNKQTTKTNTALVNIKKLLTRYFGGVLLQITLISIYVYVLLTFFGVPNSFLIAFFAAVINVIPYIGPIIGALFAVLVAISSSLDVDFYMITLPMIFKVLGTFATMQLLDGFVLQPYIFSNSVKAHPLEIFIVVIIGAKVGGITGMVLAIPAYTILRVIASVFLIEFKIVQNLTKSINDNSQKGAAD